MNNKFVFIAINVCISVVILTSVLVPIIGDSMETETISANPDKLVISSYTAWTITSDGKLFGCGDNEYGQQGVAPTIEGDEYDEYTVPIRTFTQRLTDQTVKDVACSSGTTWAVTTDGKLFGCGDNQYGQQGDGTTTDVTTFTQRLTDQTVKDVVCSTCTTFAVTTDGKLFGCGNNTWGQTSDLEEEGMITEFTQRLSDQTIKSVVCSNDTTWAVTTDGKLFGCGVDGGQGDDTGPVRTMTQRLSDQTIKSVACSRVTTWAVTTDGKLFGCGNNSYGQQGDGTTTDVTTFTQRLSDQTIKDVVCTTDNTWALTTNGKMFGCGNNESGLQGDGTTDNVTTFTQRLTDQTVKVVACSDSMVMALTTDGKLYGTGWIPWGDYEDGVKSFTLNSDIAGGSSTVVKNSPINTLLETIPVMIIIAIVVMTIAVIVIDRKG